MGARESAGRLTEVIEAMPAEEGEADMKKMMLAAVELFGGLCVNIEKLADTQASLLAEIMTHKYVQG